MKVRYLLIAAAMLAAPLAANADRWHDDDRGYWHEREFKQEYYDGYCKVKRKYKNGEYKEKRECKEPRRYRSHRHYDDDDEVIYSVGPRIIIDPGIRLGVFRD